MSKRTPSKAIGELGNAEAAEINHLIYILKRFVLILDGSTGYNMETPHRNVDTPGVPNLRRNASTSFSVVS